MNEVVLHFYLEEEVTPEIFAQKVAKALARSGAIRVGERVCSGDYVYEYTGEQLVPIGMVGNRRAFETPNIEQIHP